MSSKASTHYLHPVHITDDDFCGLEGAISEAFRKRLYFPLLKKLQIAGSDLGRLENAKRLSLAEAIEKGRIRYEDGRFVGRFSASTSSQLRELGAQWDRATASYLIDKSNLPQSVRQALLLYNQGTEALGAALGDKLRQFLPADIAGSVDAEAIFASSLKKVDKKIDASVKSIAVLPKLTKDRTKRIAAEWRDNIDKYITDFAVTEIKELRDKIADHVLTGRREAIIDEIKLSYGVTERKARFLARQETNLLLSKFKEVRYAEAGVHEYRWQCVAGSPKHPVRPSHKILQGKIFRFDDPPVTTMPGQPVRRNNPGEDFNCRCTARPVVRGTRGKIV